MTFDAIEKNGLEQQTFSVTNRLRALGQGYRSSLAPDNGIYSNGTAIGIESSIFKSLNFEGIDHITKIETVKGLWNGYDIYGNKTLGLSEIADWKVNNKYRYANLKQHAGYLAEVISTQKENIIAQKEKTGIEVYRADDLNNLPDYKKMQLGDSFISKNDQYVDKIRFKPDGTYETVQTKFFGKNPDECYTLLKTKQVEKYINSKKVDKIEIANDHYDPVIEKIHNEKAELRNNIEKLTADGKIEDLQKKQTKIEKLDKLENKLEKSTISSTEAMNTLKAARAHKAGLSQAKQAAGLTAVVSGVENYQKYNDGEITGAEAVGNVAKDTAVAGGVGYVSGAVTELAGGSCLPAAAITMGVESYDDIKDYAEGNISSADLAYNLGENAARTVGGVVGAAAGSVGGPVGSLAAGAVVSAGAAKAYEVGVDVVSDTVNDVKDFIDDEISGEDLAYNLGENTFRAAGALAGGLVFSDVTSDIATEVYAQSVEYVEDHIGDVVEAGAEIADAVGEKATEVKDAVTDIASDAADNVKEFAEEVKDVTAEKIDDVKDFASEVKDVTAERIDDAKEFAKDAAETVSDKASEIKESASNFGDSVDETIGDFKKNIKDIFD